MARKRVRIRQDKVRVVARAVGSNTKRTDISRQVELVEAFEDSVLSSGTLVPPYAPTLLTIIFEKSNILRQCIDAMVTNIAKMGYRVVPSVPGGVMEDREKEILESFIESPNVDETLVGLRAKQVHDYEHLGYYFIEVIRNAKGDPSLLKHTNASTIRLTRKDETTVVVKHTVSRGGRRSIIKERKRFRRYIQVVGTKKVYYKEFGDPRIMDYRTGKYDGVDGYTVKKGNEATEILHRKQYSADQYGVPRWIAQVPSILGSREAEEVNLRYFEDNTVPPMILSVAGGRLTRQSFSDLNNLLQAQGVGRDRQNQIMLIEAIPETQGLDDKGTVSIKIDKLVDQRPSDGLFREYDDANISKVRSAFRLPPVTIGMSQDVTFATANVSAFLAESQVFAPERAGHDEFLNKGFVNHRKGLNLKTVKLESKGPAVTNPDQIVKTLTAINPMGGVTPRSAIAMVNETMQLSLPQYPTQGQDGYAEWMDEPMPLSLRKQGTQQTGEGGTTHTEQEGKDQDIKDREGEGETNPEPVEHGQE